MIERYSRKEMSEVWGERAKYVRWLEVELAVCRELAADGVIPPKEWKELQKNGMALLEKGGVDPARVAEHEATLKHDVISFTTAVAEKVGPTARYIHFGLTSSDVIDTAFALTVADAARILTSDLTALRGALLEKAEKYKGLPTIGRSHGISAEPTAFGLRFLGWYCEFGRDLERLTRAAEGMATGKLSGA
ncbi:MAG TPA: lyase family protein, partial [Bdellovibrionota bacterium]|nr:lyase family protein [Bdellovibrionota bacterium]